MSELAYHHEVQSVGALRKRLNLGEMALLIVVTAFVFVNGVALSLAIDGQLEWQHLFGPIVWLILFSTSFLVLTLARPGHDPMILPIVGLMSGWGLILLDRLAPNFLQRQILWLAISATAMLAVAIIPQRLHFLRRYRYSWLIFGLLLLGATLVFGVNPSGQGIALWLRIPFLGRVFFQPAELLKLLLVIFLASYFDERQRMFKLNSERHYLAQLSYLGPLTLMWGFCFVILVWQRDLGTATLFFVVFVALLFTSTGEKRYVAGGIVLLLLAGAVGYFLFDVVALRIDTWLNPWIEASSRGFQIVQSLYAVAAGSIIGQGVAQGFPTFIPVVHSDFAFAAIAEEWGLIGSLATVACFALLAYRGLRIASIETRPFRLYLATGIAILFSVQALLIMSGVTKILPLTGVTLPFVSYGGSSLLISFLMVGFLLNLSSNSRARFTRFHNQ